MSVLRTPERVEPSIAGRAGPEQGVIDDARHRQRRRRGRTMIWFAIVLAGVGGVALVAGVSGSAHKERHHGAPARTVTKAHGSPGFGVVFSPQLDGGGSGWCVSFSEGGVQMIGGCAGVPVASEPIAMRLTNGSSRSHVETIYLLTTPQVASVLVEGRRFPTLAVAELPYGLRAARVLLPARSRISPSGRRTYVVRTHEPSMVALDAHGRPIRSHVERGVFESLSGSGKGPCSLRASGLPGLTAQWSHVASAIRPLAGRPIGAAFFSCIDTEYYLRHWPLDAAVLLDATHPGALPGAIPGLSPIAGMPRFFEGPGEFKGNLTAIRKGDAWLVVAGGSSLAQRIDVLVHLTATVHLARHAL
jgi:hypothetical protein